MHNPPLERTAAAVYFTCGRASRVRRRGRSTSVRYAQRQPNEETPLAYEIELGLQRIAVAPDDVALHQQLRTTALQYKAEGGRAAGLFEQMKLASRDPRQRLLHAERLWSLDAGNLNLLTKLLAALAALERSETDRDFSAVRRWLYTILSAGTAGA